jgi:O-acetyl-ADP-ribose deacetylase (regulator of RNase III)
MYKTIRGDRDMLKYKIKSLIQAGLDFDVDVIAQQCNCFNTMGSGIAPLIATAFPYAKEADLATIKGDKSKLGTFSKGVHPEGTLLPDVYNLYGQYGYGGRNRGQMDTDYNALLSALEGMARNIKLPFLTKVGLPKLGAGLGGGDWNIISKMIEDTLDSTCYSVTIYVLNILEIPKEEREKNGY